MIIIKAAIFDMDGTLLDSMSVWKGLGEEYLRLQGITPPHRLGDTIKRMSFSEAARYFKKEFDISASEEEMIAEWNEIALGKYRTMVKVKPFMMEYLMCLKKQGIKMCVATATDKIIAEEILRKLDIDSYFSFIITEQEVGVGKHSPDIFIKAAERLGEKIEDCVVFEDAYHAIKSAKEAGFTVYAIEEEETKAQKEEIMKISDKYIGLK